MDAQTTFRLPRGLLEALEQQARAEERTTSALARLLLREGLERRGVTIRQVRPWQRQGQEVKDE
jgi:hypothetical protein